MTEPTICPFCDGTGRIASTIEQWERGGIKCAACDGTGEIEHEEEESEP